MVQSISYAPNVYPTGGNHSTLQIRSPRTISSSTFMAGQQSGRQGEVGIPIFNAGFQGHTSSTQSKYVLGNSIASLQPADQSQEYPSLVEFNKLKYENLDLKAKLKEMEDDQALVLELNQLLLAKLESFTQPTGGSPMRPELRYKPVVNGI